MTNRKRLKCKRVPKPVEESKEDEEFEYSSIFKSSFKLETLERKNIYEEEEDELYNPFIKDFSKRMKLTEDEEISGKKTDSSLRREIKPDKITFKTSKR